VWQDTVLTIPYLPAETESVAVKASSLDDWMRGRARGGAITKALEREIMGAE